MNTTRRLTLIALTTLFVVTVAALWAGAPAKVSAQTRSIFTFAARTVTGPLTFVDGLFEAPWRGFDTGIFGQGFGPQSFAPGDLDGDGDLDILVGQSFFGSPGVSVLKNNGDQTFAAPIYYSLPINEVVGEVALSDFDADGDLDAFATIRGSFDEMTKIKVWRNNGDGTLAAPIEFNTGQGPVGIVLADFTGDGKPDVVTANYGGSSISFLRHNGLTGNSAGFLAPVNFSTGNRAEKIAAADVNGGGILDVVVGGETGTGFQASLVVMINAGNGNFAAPVAYDAAPGGSVGSSAVALADLDNDGDVDLIGGGAYENGSVVNGAVTIRRNNGSGTFGSAEIILFLDPNFVSNPKELTTGNLNGDAFADIVAAVPSGRAVEGFVVVNSNGLGGFNAPVYYEASQQTFDVAIADLDNDNDGDVLTLANSSAAVTVHENINNGAFVPTRYEVASLSDAVESADIDNDGDIDIVVNGEVDIASNDAIVKILKNNGNGTFAPAIDYSPPRNFADMKLRDISGDGFVDLLFAPDGNFPSYHFGTAVNNGNGTFAPTVVTNVFACGEGTIDAADLDHDGDLDIVLTEEETCPGGDAHIFVFRNDGNQNFVRMPDIALPGRLPHGLALADVTGDNNIDIITALPDGMGVFPGNGNLTFGAPIISTTRPFKFKMADFNTDGLLDVGMILQQDSFGTDTIATALGNGNGTFQAIRTQTGSSVLENLRISNDLEPGDVNGDGVPDLIVFNYASNDVSVFIVNSDGSLRPHQRYGIGNTPILGALADFTGDARLDIAAAIGLPPSGLHNAVVLLPNVGGGPQPTPTATPTSTGTPMLTPTPTATATPILTPTPTPTPTPSPSLTPAAQALNLSTRMRVLTDANVGIGGFIVTGTAPKVVLLRGIGPSLGSFGVPDPLADPVMELHGSGGFVTLNNDDWRETQQAAIEATGLAPTNDLESAILVTLPPGSYTAIVKGKNNGVGVGLVEAYNLDQASPSKLANISTRAFVGTETEIMIAGFILGGNTGDDDMILRGIGPSLSQFGVPDALPDPTLELHDNNGALLRANDNWQDDPAQAALISAAGLAPTNALESAIAATLAPGQYTVLLAGKNNGTGVGLAEAYDVGSGGPVAKADTGK